MKYIYTLDTHIQTDNEINDYYEESENYRLTTMYYFVHSYDICAIQCLFSASFQYFCICELREYKQQMYVISVK